MKINEFKKLEKKIVGHNFNKSYKSIDMIMKILSYFGNISSIFLAFFFLSSIILSVTGNVIGAFVASIILLIGLELLKRDIFDKLSFQYLSDKYLSKAVVPLLITSLLLIFLSFYSTINGAQRFSDKVAEIDSEKKVLVTNYKDSISDIYQNRLILIEDEIVQSKNLIRVKDDEQTELSSITYLTRAQRERVADLKSEKKTIREDLDKLENSLSLIKEERDSKIEEYYNEVSEESEISKEDNSNNSFLFILLSVLIELMILGGIYFNRYFSVRSYKEKRDLLEKDPGYQKWLLYDKMLSIIIKEDTKINQKLPSNKAIIDMCKVNDIIVLPKDLTDFLKIINSLNIIKTSGSAKYVSKTLDLSIEILRNHFNID